VQVQRRDRIVVRLDASTIRHANGWVDAWGVATRSGVLPYPEHGGDELRPAAEVFDAASLASLRGVPLTIDHPSELVTAATTRALTHGWVLQVVPDPPLVRVQVRLASVEVLDAVKDGILELSGGYLADFAETPGTDPESGAPYKGVQSRIRYNHLALVPTARAGHQARLTLDSRNTMRTIKIGDRTYQVTEALANKIGQLGAGVRLDAGIETEDVVIGGVKLTLPKAMVEAMLAGIGVGAAAAAPSDPPMDEAPPKDGPPAAGPPSGPDGQRLDKAGIQALVDAGVAAALERHTADAEFRAGVQRRAAVILDAAPTGADPYAVMVEAVIHLDADRKAEAEALAARARRGDLRAAGQLEGIMDTMAARTDAVQRVDHTVDLVQGLDEARRAAPAPRTDAAKPRKIEDARQRAIQRKLDAGKPAAAKTA
jgi:hypothetical protein